MFLLRMILPFNACRFLLLSNSVRFFLFQGSSFTPSSGLYATNNSVSNPANYTATQQVPQGLYTVSVCFP